MDVIELLEREHRTVEGLFEEWEAVSHDPAKALEAFNRIKENIDSHSSVEEAIFYPKVAAIPKMRRHVKQAQEDHTKMKQLLEEISKLSSSAHAWKPAVKNLKKAFDSHVKEEETELFPDVHSLVSAQIRQRWGEEVLEMKQELKKAG